MTNINLLPEDLRSKKKFKERPKKQEEDAPVFTRVSKETIDPKANLAASPPKMEVTKVDLTHSSGDGKQKEDTHEKKRAVQDIPLKKEEPAPPHFYSTVAQSAARPPQAQKPRGDTVVSVARGVPSSSPTHRTSFWKRLFSSFKRLPSKPRNEKVLAPVKTVQIPKPAPKAPIVQQSVHAEPQKISAPHPTKDMPVPLSPPPTVEKKEKASSHGLRRFVGRLTLTNIRQGILRMFRSDVERVFDVELLTEEVTGIPSPTPYFTKLFLVVFCVLLVTGGVWGYYKYQTARLDISTTAEQRRLELIIKAIDDLKRKQAEFEEARVFLDTLNTLLTYRMHWDAFFKKLESLTLKNVYYASVDVPDPGTVRLLVRATTVPDALAQIRLFRSATDFVADTHASQFDLTEQHITKVIEGEEEALGEDSETFVASFVEFPLELKLVPNWFVKK